MTMWEVLSFADKPYKGLTKAKVISYGEVDDGVGVSDEHVSRVTIWGVLSFADEPNVRDRARQR